jgi:hypothetical protein
MFSTHGGDFVND